MNELDRRARRRVVIRVALKDLLGRKLRLILTSLAIVMGVAMVSGTFVLTDTINAGFSAIFSTAYSEVGRGRDRQGGVRGLPERAVVPRVDARAGQGAARCRGRRRRDRRPGAVRRARTARSIAPRRRARPRVQHERRRSRFNPLTLVAGTWPHGPHEVASRRAHRHEPALQGRADRAGRPAGRQGAGRSRSPRSSSSGARPRSAARRSRSSTCRPRRRSSTRWASSTRSTSPRSRASTAQALVAQIQKVLPPNTQVRTGQDQAQRVDEGRRATSSRSSSTSCSPSAASRCSSARS